MKKKILKDFKICISVPLSIETSNARNFFKKSDPCFTLSPKQTKEVPLFKFFNPLEIKS